MTLLEWLRNKFKKERSHLVNLTTVQEMKRKFGARKIVDHVPLEEPPGHQVPFVIILFVFSPTVCLCLYIYLLASHSCHCLPVLILNFTLLMANFRAQRGADCKTQSRCFLGVMPHKRFAIFLWMRYWIIQQLGLVELCLLISDWTRDFLAWEHLYYH